MRCRESDDAVQADLTIESTRRRWARPKAQPKDALGDGALVEAGARGSRASCREPCARSEMFRWGVMRYARVLAMLRSQVVSGSRWWLGLGSRPALVLLEAEAAKLDERFSILRAVGDLL